LTEEEEVSVSFLRVRPHDTVLVEWVYRVRYQVYCIECGFENPTNYPHGMEWDKYDPFSIHFIALNEHGEAVGTVRLIMDSPLGFPIEEHCQIDSRLELSHRSRTAEISRLAVTKKSRCPEITLGLWRRVYLESKKLGIHYWYAAMERKLQRLLRRFHLVFEQIGAVVDYNGLRVPCFGMIQAVEHRLSQEDPAMYDYFQGGCEGKYLPKGCSAFRA